MIDRHAIQALSILLAFLSVVFWLKAAHKYKRQGMYMLVPVFYSCLIMMFYLGVALHEIGFFPNILFGTVSAWLRLVEVMVLAGMGLLLMLDRVVVKRGD